MSKLLNVIIYCTVFYVATYTSVASEVFIGDAQEIDADSTAAEVSPVVSTKINWRQLEGQNYKSSCKNLGWQEECKNDAQASLLFFGYMAREAANGTTLAKVQLDHEVATTSYDVAAACARAEDEATCTAVAGNACTFCKEAKLCIVKSTKDTEICNMGKSATSVDGLKTVVDCLLLEVCDATCEMKPVSDVYGLRRATATYKVVPTSFCVPKGKAVPDVPEKAINILYSASNGAKGLGVMSVAAASLVVLLFTLA